MAFEMSKILACHAQRPPMCEKLFLEKCSISVIYSISEDKSELSRPIFNRKGLKCCQN